MTRQEAVTLLRSGREVSMLAVAQIASAFNLDVDTPSFEIEVYYHSKWLHCGAFTARDYGSSILSPGQATILLGLINCVAFCEASQSIK